MNLMFLEQTTPENRPQSPTVMERGNQFAARLYRHGDPNPPKPCRRFVGFVWKVRPSLPDDGGGFWTFAASFNIDYDPKAEIEDWINDCQKNGIAYRLFRCDEVVEP